MVADLNQVDDQENNAQDLGDDANQNQELLINDQEINAVDLGDDTNLDQEL